jgi:hypothetical protein
MFLIVIAGTLALPLVLRSVHTDAQVGLPTPEGRLGGAVSIPTEPPPEEVVTPTPVVQTDIPDPDLCDVEPRSVDGMLALLATPAAVATPEVRTPGAAAGASPTPDEPNQPATAEIIGQIQRTVREIVACGNAGDLLRVWAFFTDDFVRASASSQPALFNRTILTARAQAQDPRTDAMPRVSSVRLLSDDRVSANVVIPAASPFSTVARDTGTVVVIFVHQSSGWLIDEVRESDGTGG